MVTDELETSCLRSGGKIFLQCGMPGTVLLADRTAVGAARRTVSVCSAELHGPPPLAGSHPARAAGEAVQAAAQLDTVKHAAGAFEAPSAALQRLPSELDEPARIPQSYRQFSSSFPEYSFLDN